MKPHRFTLNDLKASPCAKLNCHLFEVKKEKKSKRPKYNNSKVEYMGLSFDSKKEYDRYRELLLMQKAGEIGQLQRQVKYLLIEASEHEKACSYVADYEYIDVRTGQKVVEDVKSDATRKLSTYIMKRKLMFERYGIKIKEV